VKWKQYQEDVAELFRSLGFTATVEAKLSGARGVHTIDVHATQTAYGFPVTWIVECKYWNRAVPKEKVLVLGQIVADVGADRGFLLSESGFQSGAVLATQHTNVTLTSLPDLRENMQAELTRLGLAQIAQRAYALEKIAQRHFHPGVYRRADGLGKRLLELLARVFALKTIALPRAQASDFPVRLFDGAYLADSPTFLAAAQVELETIACELDALVAESTQPNEQIPRLVETFVAAVNDFLEAAQRALAASSTQEHGHRCMEALTPMRRIGDQADGLKFMLQSKEQQALRVVMRALIDGPYLLVTDPSTMPSDWMNAVHQVAKGLDELKRQVLATREDTKPTPAPGGESI
jgi:hypothetical protein